MEALKIILLCIACAIAFGIAHDLVTAHVCVEYFSVGHYNIFGDTAGPPVAYALYWGVVATWWAGLAAGLLLAPTARATRLPKLAWRQLLPTFALALAAVWLAAMLLLVFNLPLGRGGIAGIFAPRPELGEAEAAFLTVQAVHVFSYGAAALATLTVAAIVATKRIRARRSSAGAGLD